MFLARLTELVPDACRVLWRSDLGDLRQRIIKHEAHYYDVFPDRILNEAPTDPEDKWDDERRTLEAERGHFAREIRAWQDRFHLPDSWCGMAAKNTVRLATGSPDDWTRWRLERWEPSRGRFIAIGFLDEMARLYEGKAEEDHVEPGSPPVLYFVPEHLQRIRAVYLGDLKLSDVEHDYGEWEEDDGYLDSFDPRAETIDNAVKRLMPNLEHRLRQGLSRMVGEDKVGNTVPVRDLPRTRHFDWTVRYQVMDESYTCIGKTAGVDRKAITKAVHNVAELIGMTLRKPDTGGAPVKRPHCVKVVSKPGTSCPDNA